jgi:Uma2 family endonuclease
MDEQAIWDLAARLNGAPVPGVKMTEQEFEDWCDEDAKAEWVDGEVILMSPENLGHVQLAQWLFRVLVDFVESRDLGQVISREFQVRLPRQRRRRGPDVLFVAKSRLGLLRDTYFDGAPDLIFEVVSPDSVSRDWRVKYFEYERAGVKEYWVFDPLSERVEAYGLGKAKKYRPLTSAEGQVESAILSGFYLRPEWLWARSRPSVKQALRELNVRK